MSPFAKSDLRARQQDIETNEARIRQEQAEPVDHSLQPESDHHHRAHGRPGHAPQHRGGRDRRPRDDEQRRVRPADHRRHVGDRSGSRSRRDRDPNRGAQPGSQGHDRRGARSDVPRARSRRSGTARSRRRHTEHRPATGDHVQGGDHARGAGSRHPSRVHVHGGNHDREAEGRRLRADSGADRARDALQRQG